MNKIAIALYVIGGLAILGGMIIGLSAYQVPVEGYLTVTEEDFSVLFTWIGVGLISGVMMFGFAETINLLDKIKNKLGNDEPEEKDWKEEKKKHESTLTMEEILNKRG